MIPVSNLFATLDLEKPDGWHVITCAEAPLVDLLQSRFTQLCRDMKNGMSPYVKIQFTVEQDNAETTDANLLRSA